MDEDFPIIQEPFNWFILQIKLLVSMYKYMTVPLDLGYVTY